MRSSDLDHLKQKFTPTKLGLNKAFLLEHIYAYIHNKTLHRPGFFHRHKFIAGHKIDITLDKIKSVFDTCDLATQEKVLKRVNHYMNDFKADPNFQSTHLRVLEVHNYFQEHIKSKQSNLKPK